MTTCRNEGMRILGVDYGEKRVGLAISDPTGIFAQPLEVTSGEDKGAAAARIGQVCSEKGVTRIVVGLPRNMDNTLGAKAEEALSFKALIEEKTGLEVVTWDERLSTVRAERVLRETKWSREKRKRKVDMVAAQVILQGYLDFQSNLSRG